MDFSLIDNKFNSEDKKKFKTTQKSGILYYTFIVVIVIFTIIITWNIYVKSKNVNIILNDNKKVKSYITEKEFQNAQLSNKISLIKSEIDKLNKLHQLNYRREKELRYGNAQINKLLGSQNANEIILNEQLLQQTKNIILYNSITNNLKSKITNCTNTKSKYKTKLDELKNYYNTLLTKQKQNKNINTNISMNTSKILDNIKIIQLSKMLQPNLDTFKYKICYRYSTHKNDWMIFHAQCGIDTINHTITLIKSTNGEIFGGYTNSNWRLIGYKKDEHAFLFNLNSNKKFPIKDIAVYHAIFSGQGALPIFGLGDIIIRDGIVYSNFPNSYEGDAYELTNGAKEVYYTEMEVLEIYL